MAMAPTAAENLARAEALVRTAAADGARLILLPELFEGPYFCIEQQATARRLAHQVEDSPAVAWGRALAAELGVVLPLSIFERAVHTLFNTVVMVDADGALLGRYRKSHIPDGPGYCEKFYFTPGDTGFRVWDTAVGRVGVGICWDQWFPEAARAMALAGAEILAYPTAIGSEPQDPTRDTSGHWQRVMQGHAAANLMPVMAANRYGTEHSTETGPATSITFYGSSFITDATGALLEVAGRDTDAILRAGFDRTALQDQRLEWGLFRDRRPELYGALMTHGVEDRGRDL